MANIGELLGKTVVNNVKEVVKGAANSTTKNVVKNTVSSAANKTEKKAFNALGRVLTRGYGVPEKSRKIIYDNIRKMDFDEEEGESLLGFVSDLTDALKNNNYKKLGAYKNIGTFKNTGFQESLQKEIEENNVVRKIVDPNNPVPIKVYNPPTTQASIPSHAEYPKKADTSKYYHSENDTKFVEERTAREKAAAEARANADEIRQQDEDLAELERKSSNPKNIQAKMLEDGDREDAFRAERQKYYESKGIDAEEAFDRANEDYVEAVTYREPPVAYPEGKLQIDADYEEAHDYVTKTHVLHSSDEGAYYGQIQRSIERHKKRAAGRPAYEERKKARQIRKDEQEAAEQNAAEQDWNNRPMSQKIVDFVTGTDAPVTTTEFEARAKKAINKKVFNDGRMDRLASKGAKDFNGSEGLRETRVNTLKNDYVNKTAEIRAASKNIETWRDAFGDKTVDEVMSEVNAKFKADISQNHADFGDYFRHYHGKTILGGIGVGTSVLSLANSRGHMDNAQLYSDPFGG